jgi:dipeptidyl aminopeptidase/acylaminoacyl peptidase
MKKHWLTIGIVMLALAVIDLTVGHRTVPRVPRPIPTASPAVTSPSVSTMDPLEITALRSRSYVASQIRSDQNLTDQDGYRDSIVSFTSDGLSEFALEAVPESAKPASGYPVIILVHGYVPPSMYQTADNSYSDFIAAWAKAGFVVIKPDLRGNGKSQGSAVSGHYAPDYAYDVLNLIASLKYDPLVNVQQIGIVGHSMGGHIALDVAVSSSNIKATALINGVVGSMYDIFYNWPNSPAPNDQPAAVVQAELHQMIALHGTPKSNPGYYNQVSAINYVSFIRGPVQINQDVSDSTVPKLFSDHLDTVLVASGKTITYYTYPGDDHQMSLPQNRAQVLSRTTAFFKSNL